MEITHVNNKLTAATFQIIDIIVTFNITNIMK